MTPRTTLRHSLTLLVLAVFLARSSTADACAIDQRPSLSVDGQVAGINSQAPTTQAQLATWALFLFPHPFAHQQVLTLSENRRELAASLTTEALHGLCGWQLGDGTVAYGWTIHHRFPHAGRWLVNVYTWNRYRAQWEAFDRAAIVTD